MKYLILLAVLLLSCVPQKEQYDVAMMGEWNDDLNLRLLDAKKSYCDGDTLRLRVEITNTAERMCSVPVGDGFFRVWMKRYDVILGEWLLFENISADSGITKTALSQGKSTIFDLAFLPVKDSLFQLGKVEAVLTYSWRTKNSNDDLQVIRSINSMQLDLTCPDRR